MRGSLHLFITLAAALCALTLFVPAYAGEVEDAFRYLELEPTVSRATAIQKYWEVRKKLEDSNVDPWIYNGRKEKLELAWKWIEHHYDPKKPKPVPKALAPQAPPEVVKEGDTLLPFDKTLRILGVTPQDSKSTVAKKYWEMVNAIDSDEKVGVRTPLLAAAIEARRKNLRLAWDWYLYVTDKTRKYPYPGSPPPYLATYRKDSFKGAPYTIHNMVPEEYAYLFHHAYIDGGVDGVIKFLTGPEGIEPFPTVEQAKFFEDAFSLFADQWDAKATNEQRVILAQIIRGYSNQPPGQWLIEGSPTAPRMYVTENGEDWWRNLMSSAALHAETAEQYVQFVRHVLPYYDAKKSAGSIRRLLLDENGAFIYQKRFGKTLGEFMADYLDVPSLVIPKEYQLSTTRFALERNGKWNVDSSLIGLIRSAAPVLKTLGPLDVESLSGGALDSTQVVREYLDQFYRSNFTEERPKSYRYNHEVAQLEEPIGLLLGRDTAQGDCSATKSAFRKLLNSIRNRKK